MKDEVAIQQVHEKSSREYIFNKKSAFSHSKYVAAAS